MSTLKPRIESIDLLKGLVIVIMAIDHVRDYFHFSSYFFDPTDPLRTTVPIFATRFITNFCAPAFSFLAGTSAFIVGRRKSLTELSSFLIKRGLWLIFIELVVIGFGWHFDIHFYEILFQVIWVLGLSMIFLAGLIHLPRTVIFIFSVTVIFGHNLLDGVHADGNVLWMFLHERNYIEVAGHIVRVSYGAIPWVAVMSLGYYFGQFYDTSFDAPVRRKLFSRIGIACLVCFAVVRGTNVYGNLLPWEHHHTFLQTTFSFFSITKYPPSLSYLLITLGAAFLFLAHTEHLSAGTATLGNRIVSFFCTFGRVPFFFYIINIYVIHLIAMLAAELTGFGWRAMILPLMPFRMTELRGFGFDLITVYAIWAGIIVLLYPLCRWFDAYKQKNKHKAWLSYL